MRKLETKDRQEDERRQQRNKYITRERRTGI